MDSAANVSEGPRLLPRIRAAMGGRRLSPRTQEAYLAWMLRFIHHHDTRHPAAMRETEVLDFLNWLVVDRKVAHSTQMQALSALLFRWWYAGGKAARTGSPCCRRGWWRR